MLNAHSCILVIILESGPGLTFKLSGKEKEKVG